MATKVTREQVTNLFTALGYANPSKWDNKRMAAKINDLANSVADSPLPEGFEGTKNDTLLKQIVGDLDGGRIVELEGAEEFAVNPKNVTTIDHTTKKEKNMKKSTKKEDTTEKETKIKKEKTSKTPKEPKAKKEKAIRTNSVLSIIVNALKSKSLTIEDIRKIVYKQYPDRNQKTTDNTIAWNISIGSKRKGISIIKKDQKYLLSK